MSVKTTTTYKCDGCGKTKQAKDLRRFILTELLLPTRQRVAEAKTELCTDCEHKLHETMVPLWPEKEREYLAGIVR